MSNCKVVERYTNWAALKPQLKGIRFRLSSPQLACVHVEDESVTVDAAALRDWMLVVKRAKFRIEMVRLPEGFYFIDRQPKFGPPLYLPQGRMFSARHIRVLSSNTVDGQKFSARFYQRDVAADKVWQVYL